MMSILKLFCHVDDFQLLAKNAKLSQARTGPTAKLERF